MWKYARQCHSRPTPRHTNLIAFILYTNHHRHILMVIYLSYKQPGFSLMVSFHYETMQFIFTHVIVKHCVHMHRVNVLWGSTHTQTHTYTQTNNWGRSFDQFTSETWQLWHNELLSRTSDWRTHRSRRRSHSFWHFNFDLTDLKKTLKSNIDWSTYKDITGNLFFFLQSISKKPQSLHLKKLISVCKVTKCKVNKWK